MKRLLLTMLAVCAIGTVWAEDILVIETSEGQTCLADVARIDSITMAGDSMLLHSQWGVSRLAKARVTQMAVMRDAEMPSSMTIEWRGDEVAVVNPYLLHGVTVSSDAAYVAISNPCASEELTYTLSGESANGGLRIDGDYKLTLRLAGLTLSSQTGAAIHVACGKRTRVELVEGTDNTLADWAGGEQKAALYFKGHPEFAGAGTLTVSGNARHAIASKEYLQLKASTGTINILSAKGDGIHAGQYFKMNGGKLYIRGVAGDGIQAEVTGNDTDEDNGQMTINGGTVDIVTTGNDISCLKADSLLTIGGGTLTLRADGTHSRGVKAHNDLSITGGDVTITVTADGTKTDPSTGEETGDTGDKSSYKVYVSPYTSGGGMGGWGGSSSSLWGNVYLYDADGNKIATLSNSVSIRGTSGQTKTFYIYDFGKAVEGTYYFGSDDYSQSSGWGGSSSTTYTIRSSSFTAPTSGSDVYYTMSSSYSTSGTTRTYSLTNATSTYANGTLQADGDESWSSACIKVDRDAVITGGTISLSATGTGGKGMNIDGALTIGQTGGDNDSLKLTAATTGTCVSSSSSSSDGWGGMGGGMGGSLIGQPKAIKALGNIIINSGTMQATTKNDGGEGIESKATITINGGLVLCNTYDDGINAASKITVNGGVVWSWASGNDGMDVNGSSGFEFNGGIVVANGTNSPEEGFDCDNYTFKITGGTLMGIGGATSSVTSASQAYASTSSVTVTSGKYVSIKDPSGNVLLSYLAPASLSGATVLTSSPSYVSNSSCSLVYGATAVSDPTESYFDGRILVGGTLSGGSTKSITPKTK